VKFTLTEKNLNELIRKLKSLDCKKPWSITIQEYQYKITPEQNRYYRKFLRIWSQYKPLIKRMEKEGKYMPSPEEWHEYFKDKYLTEVKPFGNTTIKIQKSSQELTVAQMSKYIDTIKIFCFETIGFEFDEEDIL